MHPATPRRSARIPAGGILLGLALAACASSTAPDEARQPVLPPPVPNTEVAPVAVPGLAFEDRSLRLERGDYDLSELVDIAARPVAIFQARVLWTEGGAATVRALKQINPDLIVLGILNVLNCDETWDNPNQAVRFPFSAELYSLLHTRGFETTLGEPVYMWPEERMVNPMRRGALDETLLEDYLDLVATYAGRFPGVVDGFFHDYMSEAPWPFPVDGPVQGAVDLDGDGVVYGDDADEQSAWLGWQRATLVRLQERFGPGLVQVANGKLALVVPAFRPLLAGVWFEDFPQLVWNWGPQRALEMAMELRAPGGLVPRRGRTWTIYGPRHTTGLGDLDFRRWAAMLTGDLYETVGGTETTFPVDDTGRVDFGPPQGPAVRFDEPGGGVTYSRVFEQGVVRVRFDAAGVYLRDESGAERTAP